MKKNTISAVIGLLLVASPLIASAASIGDLQAQVQALLAQIAGLQGQGTVTTSVSAPMIPASPLCPVLSRGLSFGMRGDDVSQLQSYLGVSQTGFFGALTQQAVMNFQQQQGISAIGSVGPLTRAAFARLCGGGNGGGGSADFSADVTSGGAPLTVNFTAGDSITATATYSVDFGDGTSADMIKGSCVGMMGVVGAPSGIRCSYSAGHTYSSNGTYTARLMKNTCPAGAQCFAGPLPVGAPIMITVGQPVQNQSMTLSADPTSGAAPLNVTFTTGASISDQRQFVVEYGDGQHDVMTRGSCIGITAIVGGQGGIRCSYATSHTYAQAGTYTAILYPYIACLYTNPRCMIASIPLDKVMITVGGTSSGSIQKITPPASVTLSPTGIAEDHSDNFYFTLDSVGSQSATIDITPVGCWNDFPSDIAAGLGKNIRCMIAQIYRPPTTLTIGGSVSASTNATITLTSVNGSTATFSVASNASTNMPTVSGLDAPTSLAVGQQGTWTVHASAPSGTQLGYSVVWGDEQGAGSGFASPIGATVQTQATFTHAYQTAGTFTPVFTVSNGSGSAQTSASVVVGGGSTAGNFTATPTSGAAPLNVSFTSIAASDASGGRVGNTVVFGDGTSGALQLASVCYGCNQQGTANHTYAQPGTYTATLLDKAPPGTLGADIILGTVTVTVSGTGSQGTSFSASPSSGPAPLAVTFYSGAAFGGDIGNTVIFGDGTSGPLYNRGLPVCAACGQGGKTDPHTYAHPGTYTAILMDDPLNGQGRASIQLGTVTVTVQ